MLARNRDLRFELDDARAELALLRSRQGAPQVRPRLTHHPLF